MIINPLRSTIINHTLIYIFLFNILLVKSPAISFMINNTQAIMMKNKKSEGIKDLTPSA